MSSKTPSGNRTYVGVFDLTWLVMPMVFFWLFEFAYDRFAPASGDGDIDLLAFEIALLVPIAGFVLLTRRSGLAGWKWPAGFSWIWVAAPFWLGVVSPITLAMENVQAMPEKLPVWILISLLVAINEETLFRGLMLRGLMKSLRPMTAVVLSSLAFGGLHFLNMEAGGAPEFVAAQMVSAAGFGCVASAITLRSGSILPALLFHFLMDAVGLAALGGFEEALQAAEYAVSMAISGAILMVWGLFWSWRAVRAGKVIPAG